MLQRVRSLQRPSRGLTGHESDVSAGPAGSARAILPLLHVREYPKLDLCLLLLQEKALASRPAIGEEGGDFSRCGILRWHTRSKDGRHNQATHIPVPFRRDGRFVPYPTMFAPFRSSRCAQLDVVSRSLGSWGGYDEWNVPSTGGTAMQGSLLPGL